MRNSSLPDRHWSAISAVAAGMGIACLILVAICLGLESRRRTQEAVIQSSNLADAQVQIKKLQEENQRLRDMLELKTGSATSAILPDGVRRPENN